MIEKEYLQYLAVHRFFSRAAESYDAAATVPAEIGSRLLARLDLFRLQPRRILDLGSGTGALCDGLIQRYPKAHVVALDFVPKFLSQAKNRGKWRKHPRLVCAEAAHLPLAHGSMDLVISNLLLPWCLPPDRVFAEVARVLARGGAWLFTSLGPDTLRELRESWARVDDFPHVHPFMDMHDLGDALLRAGFADPVMDTERLTVTYPDVDALLRELRLMGAGNALLERRRGLIMRHRMEAMKRVYESFRDTEDRLPATCEIVYGLGWAPESMSRKPEGREEFRIPLAAIRHQLPGFSDGEE